MVSSSMLIKTRIAIYLIVSPGVAFSGWARVQSSPSGLVMDVVDSYGVLYLAHSEDGVFRSTDSTMTWERINNGLDDPYARIAHQLLSYGNDLYVATFDGIYRSGDSGENWEWSSNGIDPYPWNSYMLTESIVEYGGQLLTGAFSGIYRSTDGGEHWTATNITGEHISISYFADHNGILLAARDIGNFPNGYLSLDHGETWEPLINMPLPTITFYSENPLLWAGTISGVWLSSDEGASWTWRSEGLSSDPYNSCIIRVNGVLITSLESGSPGIYRSSDEGVWWEEFGEGLPFLTSVEKLIVYGDRIIAATSDGLWQRDTSEIVVGLEPPKQILPELHMLSQNYPNPFNAATHIEYSIPISSRVIIRIHDLLGKQVATLVDERKQEGDHFANFKPVGLTSGIYFYSIQVGNYSETKSMIFLE